MPLHKGEEQARLQTYKAPVYGYRRAEDGTVEKDLFDGKRPEGWHRSPADVPAGDDPALKEDKPVEPATEETGDASEHFSIVEQPEAPEAPAEEAEAEGDESARLEPPYDQYGINDLRKEVRIRFGKGPSMSEDKATLVKRLEDMDAQEAAGE